MAHLHYINSATNNSTLKSVRQIVTLNRPPKLSEFRLKYFTLSSVSTDPSQETYRGD